MLILPLKWTIAVKWLLIHTFFRHLWGKWSTVMVTWCNINILSPLPKFGMSEAWNFKFGTLIKLCMSHLMDDKIPTNINFKILYNYKPWFKHYCSLALLGHCSLWNMTLIFRTLTLKFGWFSSLTRFRRYIKIFDFSDYLDFS